jgi:hypothetical protein
MPLKPDLSRLSCLSSLTYLASHSSRASHASTYLTGKQLAMEVELQALRARLESVETENARLRMRETQRVQEVPS